MSAFSPAIFNSICASGGPARRRMRSCLDGIQELSFGGGCTPFLVAGSCSDVRTFGAASIASYGRLDGVACERADESSMAGMHMPHGATVAREDAISPSRQRSADPVCVRASDCSCSVRCSTSRVAHPWAGRLAEGQCDNGVRLNAFKRRAVTAEWLTAQRLHGARKKVTRTIAGSCYRKAIADQLACGSADTRCRSWLTASTRNTRNSCISAGTLSTANPTGLEVARVAILQCLRAGQPVVLACDAANVGWRHQSAAVESPREPPGAGLLHGNRRASCQFRLTTMHRTRWRRDAGQSADIIGPSMTGRVAGAVSAARRTGCRRSWRKVMSRMGTGTSPGRSAGYLLALKEA